MSICYVESMMFSLVGWVVYVNAVRKSNDIRNTDLCVIVFWLLYFGYYVVLFLFLI